MLAFLRHLEQVRGNGIATRNQRLAALRTFFEYLGRRCPEALHLCQQVAAIPTKRTPLPDTRFIARAEVERLFDRLPDLGRLAARDRALLLFSITPAHASRRSLTFGSSSSRSSGRRRFGCAVKVASGDSARSGRDRGTARASRNRTATSPQAPVFVSGPAGR